MRTHILVLAVLTVSFNLAYAMCNPPFISWQEAFRQSRRLPSKTEALPGLPCGWHWMRDYEVTCDEPQPWHWLSWPDGTHVKLGTREPVQKVLDGDTVRLQAASFTRTVRLMGIDSPDAGQEPWATRSKSTLAQLLPVGSSIGIATFRDDEYRRTLAWLLTQESDIGLEMLRAGAVTPWVVCEKNHCDQQFLEGSNVAEYVKACQQARTGWKGIFDPSLPIPQMPYEFRLQSSGQAPKLWVGDFVTRKLFAPESYVEVDVCSRVFFSESADALALGYKWGAGC